MRYQNPILRGFNPDPSICRVGKDYYLVTSTFEYFPGIPVYHSRDLINWKQIGNCIERPEQLDFTGVRSSEGIWAPTIRYEQGVFYVTATFSGRGNFYVTSTNPATGWSDPVWVDFTGIDPSIFFEDDEMYYCANDIGDRQKKHGSEGFSLAKMDKVTGKVLGEIRRIWTGNGGGWVESPHIYHVGEYYYLFASEGGTNQGHMVTVARSRNIWGPYEGCPENPILTNRDDTSKQISCSGHCDLVEDTYGNWWIVHLGTRSDRGLTNLGRETFLMPVTWVDGWPVIGWDKKSHLVVDLPDRCLLRKESFGVSSHIPVTEQELTQQALSRMWNCNFESETWEPQWLFRRIPDMQKIQRGNGKLILDAADGKLEDAFGTVSGVFLRPLDKKCSVETVLDFEPTLDGACAGLTAYLTEDYFYRIMKIREAGKNYLVVERRMEDVVVEAFRQEVPTGKLMLKIANDGEKYHFSYGLQKEDLLTSQQDAKEADTLQEVATAATKFLSTEIVGKSFTGTLFGVFAEADACRSEGEKGQVSNGGEKTIQRAVFSQFRMKTLRIL